MKRRREVCRDTLRACCTSQREGVSTQGAKTSRLMVGGWIQISIISTPEPVLVLGRWRGGRWDQKYSFNYSAAFSRLPTCSCSIENRPAAPFTCLHSTIPLCCSVGVSSRDSGALRVARETRRVREKADVSPVWSSFTSENGWTMLPLFDLVAA